MIAKAKVAKNTAEDRLLKGSPWNSLIKEPKTNSMPTKGAFPFIVQ